MDVRSSESSRLRCDTRPLSSLEKPVPDAAGGGMYAYGLCMAAPVNGGAPTPTRGRAFFRLPPGRMGPCAPNVDDPPLTFRSGDAYDGRLEDARMAEALNLRRPGGPGWAGAKGLLPSTPTGDARECG